MAGLAYLFLLPIHTIESAIAKRIQPDGQGLNGVPDGAGEGLGVALGSGVEEAVGSGVVVVGLVLSAVGTTGSGPVTERKPNRIRAWAEVVSSPRKRKLGVSYGSGKPSKAL